MLHSFPMMIANSVGGGGFIIEGSGLFDGSTGYLSRTPGTAGNDAVGTVSFICKRGPIGVAQHIISCGVAATRSQINFSNEGTGGRLEFATVEGGLQTKLQVETLRDLSAYYHFVINWNTDDTTAATRYRFYQNGVELTTFIDNTRAAAGVETVFNRAVVHEIGRYVGASAYFSGYLPHICMIDGLQLDPTSFGEVTDDGFWQINDASDLTFGTNGFLIEGGVDMAAGTDSSGNSNNFSKTGSIISTSDSPTSGGDEYGNMPVYNPLINSAGTVAFSAGNTVFTASSATISNCPLTFGAKSGKFYAECEIGSATARDNQYFGIAEINWPQWEDSAAAQLGRTANSAGIKINTGPLFKVLANTGTEQSFGITPAIGDRMICAFDADTGDVWMGIWDASAGTSNWIDSGTTVRTTDEPGSGTNPTQNWGAGELKTFGSSNRAFDSNNGTTTLHMHSSDWLGTVPSGFSMLATQNLPTPAIINPDDHFHSEVVTHNGTSTASTCTFNLDTYEWLAIIKNTTGAVENWYWINSIRGVTKHFPANSNTAEATDANILTVSGTTFTLGSTLGAKDYLVEFHKAGLAASTASDTDGTINTTSTSVNTVSGFSIGVFTGTAANATVGHGLGNAPEFMIVKNLSQAEGDSPLAWHDAMLNTQYLTTNGSGAANSGTDFWNNTSPTATTISVSSQSNSNGSSDTMLLLAWHSVEGYSSFGSYEGNGSADGPFINMGFHAQSQVIKDIDAANAWMIHTTDIGNVGGATAYLNYTTGIVGTNAIRALDFNSNGTKLRGANANINTSGTYIYGAWGGRALTDGAINQGRAK